MNKKTLYKLFFFVNGWWSLWLLISISAITDLNTPNAIVYFQFFLLMLGFNTGFLLYFSFPKRLRIRNIPTIDIKYKSTISVLNTVLVLLVFFLLFCLLLSGFFATDFVSYHITVRSFTYGGSLTGSKTIDLVSKILVYPAIFTIALLLFSQTKKIINKYLLLFALFLYCLLWQVNYPLIFLFWAYLISVMFCREKTSYKNFVPLLIIVFALLAAASLRFGTGKLSYAVIEHYIINYHLIGFSFYDYHFANKSSILHDYSFGRSSIGFIEQLFDLLFRAASLDFSAASFENRDHNMKPVQIGNGFEGNAFGTILFSFYRDFSYSGIIIGSVLYGLALSASFCKSKTSFRARAVFIMLTYGWLTGMMVSPLEQGYFWFSLMCIFGSKLLNVKGKL